MDDYPQVAPFWAFTTDKGVPMAAKIFTQAHAPTKLLISFYDLRYPFNIIFKREDAKTLQGQFISRYYVETLMEHEGGLTLDDGVAGWEVDANNMEAIMSWMDAFVARRQDLYGDV